MESGYELFRKAAAEHPASRIIFPDEGKEYSYAGFLDEVDVCARALHACGVGRGDRVALHGPNSSCWMLCFFAVNKIGAVAVPMNIKAMEDDMLYMAAEAQVKLLFHFSESPVPERLAGSIPVVVTAEDFDGMMDMARTLPDVGPEPGDLQIIMFTSGTTANPKGVMLCRDNIRNSVEDYIRIMRLGPDDVMLLNLPLSYCYGCVLICCTFFLAGASLVVKRTFTVRGTLGAISRYRCTVLNMVPTMYQLLFSSGLVSRYDLSSVKKVMTGGSSVSDRLMSGIRELFGPENVLCGYGLTECASWALSQRFDGEGSRRGVSIGRPAANMEIRIEPGYGTPAEGESLGELCLRGKGLMHGYLDGAKNASAFDADGWFHTGDVVRCDRDGVCWIVDRCKDMIIKGGENISPKRVEYILDSFDGIEGSQVVGVHDSVYGEKVVAVLLCSQAEKIDIKELTAFARTHLSSNRRPDYYVALPSIPCTPNEKVNKQAVRDLVNAKIGSLRRNVINYL